MAPRSCPALPVAVLTPPRYAYSLKSTLSENADKFSAEDLKTLTEKVDETVSFLENNSEAASKDEIESHQKELEAVSVKTHPQQRQLCCNECGEEL